MPSWEFWPEQTASREPYLEMESEQEMWISITLAMNMFSHGVDPNLIFQIWERFVKNTRDWTRMHVYERQPYAGELVFTAFSGSHQDAIAKGMAYREEKERAHWTVPYLPIDPKDVGREYDSDVIRINSQSGKGGVNYILKTKFWN